MNTDLDSDTVKAIFLGDDSGTLISAYDSCNIANYYVSYQHSGNELQIIDNTDTCSPRTIFDSSLGGWQESSTAGWIPAEDGKYDYPRYTLKSEYNRYNMSLSSSRSPKGCLFSTTDGGFAGYKIVDGIYFNVHEKFDSSKMFADSSYPVLYLAMADITKQLYYHIMLIHSAAMGEGYEQAGWMILAEDENENYYPIYAENAFDWSGNSDGPQIVVTTAGWQSEYVDLATGKLKLPANGSISDVGRSMMLISESSDITEDLLGDYIASTPFTKVEGVYKWSNLTMGDWETLKLSGNAYKIIQPQNGESITIPGSNESQHIIVLGTVYDTIKIGEGTSSLTFIGNNNGNLKIDLSDLSDSSAIPNINIISDSEVIIIGNRFNIKSNVDITIREIAQTSSWPSKDGSIETSGNVDYRFERAGSSYDQPLNIKCKNLYLKNENNLSRDALRRKIIVECEYLTVSGNTDFLHNEYNKYNTITDGSRLVVKMPVDSDGCYAFPNAGPGSVIGDKYLFAEPDTCTSIYNRRWLTIQDYVNLKASNNSVGHSHTVIAKSRRPIDAYDTCASYNVLYLNGHFADDYDSDMAMSSLTLLRGDTTGDCIRIDYSSHNPSSLSLYVYDVSGGTDMSGAVTQELYKNGEWMFDFTSGLRSNSSWKINSDLSVEQAQIINKLFAESRWEYIPLSFVQDGLVPPNVYGEDLNTFFEHSMSSGALADTSFYTGYPILYQCVWEGNISLGHADYSSITSARVVFKPI